jgi:hypothetical protein
VFEPSHGQSDHAAYDKGHCYVGGTRIPLLLRWPELFPPHRRIAMQRRPLRLPHLVSHLVSSSHLLSS